MRSILLTDDDRRLRESLAAKLREEGFDVLCASGVDEAMEIFSSHKVDLAIIDVVMPVKSGFVLCSQMRSIDALMPILFLTGSPTEEFEVRSLRLGADDFLSKSSPFPSLLARILRMLERAEVSSQGGTSRSMHQKEIHVGSMIIDCQSRFAENARTRIPLTFAEVAILEVLDSANGAFLRTNEIIKRLHGPHYRVESSTIRSQIFRLKAKLLDDGLMIEAKRFFGYRLKRSPLNSRPGQKKTEKHIERP